MFAAIAITVKITIILVLSFVSKLVFAISNMSPMFRHIVKAENNMKLTSPISIATKRLLPIS